MQALLTEATNILFGGASEGGKSAFIRFACIIWAAAIPNLQVYIFRKYYGDVLSHMEGSTGFRALLRPWVDQGIVKITENEIRWVKTGSLISLNQIRNKDDLEKHRGREKHVLVLDESTQIPEAYIKELEAWTRMPQEMKDLLPEQLKNLYPHIKPEERKELFPRVIKAANPEGLSFSYHKRTYVLPREPFKVEKSGAWKYQFIPSKILDNPSADPIAQAARLSELGEARARALISGDWSSPSGDFFTEYDDDVHSVPDFVPPNYWFKYRTFDWGSGEPFACYWWCVSDGEEITAFNGTKMTFPSGAIIAYREWYGCDPNTPAKGIHMRNEDIAKGIVERTLEQTSGITLSDSYPFSDRGEAKKGRKYTMADDFFENGCPLTRGNTARVFGYKQMRSRLQGDNNIPMFYVVKGCIYLREYIPALPRHDSKPEDAAESGESTHSTDAARLACAARPWTRTKPVEDTPLSNRFKTVLTSNTPKQLLQHLNKKRAGRRY
jgi:hypothetical protein